MLSFFVMNTLESKPINQFWADTPPTEFFIIESRQNRKLMHLLMKVNGILGLGGWVNRKLAYAFLDHFTDPEFLSSTRVRKCTFEEACRITISKPAKPTALFLYQDYEDPRTFLVR